MITTKDKTSHAQVKNNDQNNPGPGKMPKENPGKTSNLKEEVTTPHETEASKQREGADTSFSEQTDVTPPNKREFPSFGNAKTDFVSRPQGRTTGRMIGHEPGTEGI